MRGARLSYANVVATLALFVALGGGAYATQGRRSDLGTSSPMPFARGTSPTARSACAI